MQENSFKCIQGKKIRRQGFSIPLIILYSMMFAIPYTIFAISWCVGKLDTYGSPSAFWTSVLVCFLFSVPFLVLRLLNKYFFGKIICVLDEEGIYYANKEKLCWDSIEKIEYVIDSKPRYKGDSKKTWRAIIYTHGGKHVVLEKAPLYIISSIKKYQKSLDVKIIGANSLVTPILIMATILLICPFYVVLLRSAPEGVTIPHIIVMIIICVALGIVRMQIFDAYDIQYRFWSKLLPKKLLSHIVLGFYYSSYFIALIILFYFPNWVVVSLLGIYLGIVQPPIPSKNGSSRYRIIPSYKQLYEIYITQADFWEERIAKRKANKGGVVMGKWYDDYKKLDLLGGKISFILEDDEDMIEIHYKDGMLIDVGYKERMHSYFITVVSSDTADGWKQPVEEVKVEDKTVLADKIQETIYKYRR